MNPLNITKGFDSELHQYFETELEYQNYSLSFIPDENSISPLCAAMMGNVMVNSCHKTAFQINASLEKLTSQRICKLFNADYASVKTITIEAASRVVFQALAHRSDVVMSLDMRKQEHCNSESLAYRFVNFSISPDMQHLDMDLIAREVLENKPRLIIVSPINYPLAIDYARFAEIAKSVGAVLWCDISQVAGLVAAGSMPSPFPYADVVTFTAHGAFQGPHCSVIVSTKQYAGAIERAAVSAGHSGLSSAELAALSARLTEIQSPEYKAYCQTIMDNAHALAEGLQESGVRLVGGGTESHLVVADMKGCALSARGALESLAECGIMVRVCQVQTADPNTRFDSIRFSVMPATTRGLLPAKLKEAGQKIAAFLLKPEQKQHDDLKSFVRNTTVGLPMFNTKWLHPQVKANLVAAHYLNDGADPFDNNDGAHQGKIKMMAQAVHAVKAVAHHK